MASALHPHFKNTVFEPDVTHALATAFDEICKDMNLPETAAQEREILAIRVIDLARDGILDPQLLRTRVLHEARAAL